VRIYYNYLPSNALVSTNNSYNFKMIRLGLQYHSRHTQEVPDFNLGHDTGYPATFLWFSLLPLHKCWYSPSIRHAHINIPSISPVTNCSNISATLTLQLSQLFKCRKFIKKNTEFSKVPGVVTILRYRWINAFKRDCNCSNSFLPYQ
jgi:hypothetical protein